MRILLASSEVHPFSKTGGLADMVGALGKALAHAGHEVRIVTPLYRGIREKFPQIKREDWQFDLPLGARWLQAELCSLEVAKGLVVYFIHQPGFLPSRRPLSGRRHQLRGQRRAVYFFLKMRRASRAVFAVAAGRGACQRLADRPGAGVDVAATAPKGGGIRRRSACPFTIWRIKVSSRRTRLPLTNLPPEFFTVDGAEFYGGLNCLKAGIAFADVITTVSPRYAREITTEEFGCGLDDRLRRRQDRLFGILNGMD